MNKRELYRDVLNEGSASEFEEAVFQKTLGTARRARRIRVAGRSAVLALVALCAALLWFPRREVVIVNAPTAPREIELSHHVLRSEPFTGTIRTEEFAAIQIAATAQSAALLKTGEWDSDNFHLIDDEELLKFFAGEAVALVHHGPNDAELIFPDGSRRQ